MTSLRFGEYKWAAWQKHEERTEQRSSHDKHLCRFGFADDTSTVGWKKNKEEVKSTVRQTLAVHGEIVHWGKDEFMLADKWRKGGDQTCGGGKDMGHNQISPRVKLDLSRRHDPGGSGPVHSALWCKFDPSRLRKNDGDQGLHQDNRVGCCGVRPASRARQ